MNFINKKAQLTQNQLIGLLIAILCFAILMILFFVKFYPALISETNKNTCTNSVLMRAAILEKIGVFEKATTLPALRCKTEYYCLTMGSECPEKYTKVSVKDEKEINEKIANYMYDCWSQLGDGKRIFSRPLFRAPEECVICSEIMFAPDVQSAYKEINLAAYLNENIIPNKNMTYSKYITFKDINTVKTAQNQAILLSQELSASGLAEIAQSNIKVIPYDFKTLNALSCRSFNSIP